jgi:hypothetical protein
MLIVPLLILFGFAAAQLNEWNLLVGGRPEWFCGACAVPDNWTLVEPSLVVLHSWPLNFTLWSKQSYAAPASVSLLYRRRACNLSAHWLQGDASWDIDMPLSEDWLTISFTLPAYSGLVRLELLTADCELMLANISASGSEPSSSSSSEPAAWGKIVALCLILGAGVPLFIVIIVLIVRYRRQQVVYRTMELNF